MVSRLRRLNYLDYYIDKYGEDDGIRKYNERIIKAVSKKDSSKVKKRISVSNESMTLFNSVYSLLYGIVDLSDVRYGSDRQVGEYAIYTRKLGDFLNVRFLDFSIPKYKLDIEFDGDYWHPTITEDDLIEFSTGVVKNISVYNHLIKDYLLRNLGWEVLHIKEHDYLENPSREINKCIDFIKSIVLYNKKIKTLSAMYKVKRFGYCPPDTGCIEKDKEGNWRVINNKKGGYWKAKYSSREKAENALKAYHANK